MIVLVSACIFGCQSCALHWHSWSVCRSVDILIDKQTSKWTHDDAWMNMNEHEWAWMNMNEHEWTWMNMNEHEWTWMNMNEPAFAMWQINSHSMLGISKDLSTHHGPSSAIELSCGSRNCSSPAKRAFVFKTYLGQTMCKFLWDSAHASSDFFEEFASLLVD